MEKFTNLRFPIVNNGNLEGLQYAENLQEVYIHGDNVTSIDQLSRFS